MSTAAANLKPKNLSIQVPEPHFIKIDPTNLSKMMNDNNVVIVDVRDEDYIGGHIKGSIRLSFGEFEQKVDELVKTLIKEQKKDTIVFTCMYSEQRGPSCACTFTEALEKQDAKHVKVYVLSGGFHGWLKAFAARSDVSDYISEVDEAQWRRDMLGNYLHVLDSQFLEFAQNSAQNQ